MEGEPVLIARGKGRRWPRQLAPALAVVAALWLAWWAAGGVTREGPLKPTAGFKKAEKAWMAPVPRELRGRIDAGSAVVWEEGNPLWRLTARKVVEGGEPGTCFIRRDVIVFVPSDGSDPGHNGRSYALRGPAALPWGWFAAIGVMLAVLQMVSRSRGSSVVAPSAPWTFGRHTVVFLATFAGRAIWLWLHPDYNDGFMMAKGCPYSDAQAWLELANSLARGFGLEGVFASQRPLYPVLLAPWLAVGGPEVFLAQMVNAATGALTATFLGALAAQVAGRATGVGVSAVIAFTGFQSGLLPLAMSETVAMSFVALAIVFILRGMRSGRLWSLAVGGGLFGLANLVCTFTLLVWVLSGMAAAAAGCYSQRRWTPLITHGGAVVLGAAMVLGPWVVRQRAVYGVTTVSLQAAEMLYAPVSPSGRYSSGLVEEPARAGVPDQPAARYRYFSEQWRKKVAAGPGAYLRTIAANVGDFFRVYPLEAIPLRALLLLTAGAAAWRLAARGAGWNAWAAAALAGGCIASIGWWPPGWGLLLVAAGAVGTRDQERRWLAMLMLALLLGVGVMDAVTGNSITRRFWSVGEGAVVVLAIMAVVHAVGGLSRLLARVMRGTESTSVDTTLGDAPDGRFENVAAVIMVLWAVLSTGWVLRRTLAGPLEVTWSVPADQSDLAWSETLRRLGRTSEPHADSRVWVRPVEFIGRGCHLSGRENIHHWSRAFSVRRESRTVAFARVMPERLLRCLQLRGEAWSPDRQGRFVVVGVRNIDLRAPLGHETEIIEALAVFPVIGNAGSEKVDLAGGVSFERSDEVSRITGW